MSESKQPGPDRARAVILPIVFALVAAILFGLRGEYEAPIAPARNLPHWVYSVSTVRQPLFEPTIEHVGFTYRCDDCHNLFPSPPETDRSLTQHRHISLQHGTNARCLNCHQINNRNFFAGDGEELIPFDKPELLCARCHGLVYRDWQHGVHGRSNGYWDTAQGGNTRRICTECHEPHQPPFPPMIPAPGPSTLRMGVCLQADDHGHGHNPLRVNTHGQPVDQPDSAPTVDRGPEESH